MTSSGLGAPGIIVIVDNQAVVSDSVGTPVLVSGDAEERKGSPAVLGRPQGMDTGAAVAVPFPFEWWAS